MSLVAKHPRRLNDVTPKRRGPRPEANSSWMLEMCNNGDADVDMQAVGHVNVDMHIGPSVQGGANMKRGLVIAHVSHFLPITTPLHSAHLLSSSLASFTIMTGSFYCTCALRCCAPVRRCTHAIC
jgi:hypothetical protein